MTLILNGTEHILCADTFELDIALLMYVYDQSFDRWSITMYELDLAFRESVVHFLRQALSVTIQKQKTKTYPAFKEF